MYIFLYICPYELLFLIVKPFFMAVQFKMIPKKNNLVTPPEVKYFPCLVSKGEENLDSLAKIIASRSTISKADCYGVIIALSDVIGEALCEGKIVRIESLGSFKLGVTGSPADSPEPLGKANITGFKILYQPSANLKSKIKKTQFKRIR
jgi:predicted histone-like DNA-binding protein